jgi:phage gp45-like
MLEARVFALERQIDALMRRRGSPFALARTTTNASDGGPVQTVQARLNALSVRDKIPLLYGFGMTASPPIGADLHVAFLDGDPSKAVAIASGHQTFRLRGLAAGDSALYDSRGHRVWLTPAGITIGGNITHTGDTATIGNVTHTGNLHVTGEIIAGHGGGDQVGLQTHKHPSNGAPPTPNT